MLCCRRSTDKWFIPPHHPHSDGQRLIFVACNDLVPWTLLTCDQTESLPLNIAASYKQQWYSDEQLQKKMSGPVSVHMGGWWNMIPSSHFPSISPWRWIRKTKVKDEEREREREKTSEGFVYTRNCEGGVSKKGKKAEKNERQWDSVKTEKEGRGNLWMLSWIKPPLSEL